MLSEEQALVGHPLDVGGYRGGVAIGRKVSPPHLWDVDGAQGRESGSEGGKEGEEGEKGD